MSCLLMGLGHPALLPEGWTRLGLFPCSPLSPTPRPGLACLPATPLPPLGPAGESQGLRPWSPGPADPLA